MPEAGELGRDRTTPRVRETPVTLYETASEVCLFAMTVTHEDAKARYDSSAIMPRMLTARRCSVKRTLSRISYGRGIWNEQRTFWKGRPRPSCIGLCSAFLANLDAVACDFVPLASLPSLPCNQPLLVSWKHSAELRGSPQCCPLGTA